MKINSILLIIIVSTTMLNAQNESKLVLEASNNQTNDNPLLRLRFSFGTDLLWISSDHPTNSYLGYKAGEKNMTGIANTAIGRSALYATNSGQYNSAAGAYALANNPNGSYNTAIGNGAMTQTYTASHNVAIGNRTGYIRDFGWNNVLVGANTDANQDDLFNVVVIGQGTIITSSSTVRFGNSATGSYGGWANWTNISDSRYKKNIKANVIGLDFILKLRPVTYQLSATSLSRSLGENASLEWTDSIEAAMISKEKVVQSGFIAQEVEAVAETLGYDFSGVDLPKNSIDFYGLRYDEFVVPLVKSVQELNQTLVRQNEHLKAERDRLILRLKQIEGLLGANSHLAEK